MELKNEPTGRRKFISRLSASCLVACVPIPEIVSAQEYKAENTFLCPPYLQNVGTDAATIMWITSNESSGWVEVREGGAAWRKVYATKNGLRGTGCIHKVRLTGLSPATAYEYRIFAKELTLFEPYKVIYGNTLSKTGYSFITVAEKAESTSFIVLNDMHNRPDSIRHLLKNYTKADEYDFVVLNGDMFNHVDREEEIVSDLLLPVSEYFSAQKPFLMVQGNHEVRGKFARELFDYFDYKSGSSYYAFTQGPVRFVVLDSGEDKADEDPAYAGLTAFDAHREAQAKWLQEEIARPEFKKAPFRVVFIHIPVFHSGDWHGTTHCRQLFHPLFNKGKVDLVISGHTHSYGTFQADAATHHYPIMIGGGPKAGRRTIMKARADREHLSIRMLRDDGTEVGALNLKRR